MSSLTGKARLQELAARFPELPAPIVLRADVTREGVRHAPFMAEVAKLSVAEPYVEYPRQDYARDKSGNGAALAPLIMGFRNGGMIRLTYNAEGPYEVKGEGTDHYWLSRDGEPVADVFFPPSPGWYRKTTSTGKPMGAIASVRAPGALFVVASNHCQYFAYDRQCWFCNMNPAAEHLAATGHRLALVKAERDIYETYLACAEETGVVSVNITSGSLVDRKKETDLYLRVLGGLRRAMQEGGCEAPVGVAPQALANEDQLRLKAAGVTSIHHAMEVWSPELFPIVCPGKAENVGREAWIEALVHAVDIFGRGHVSANFVLGVELVPPFGFETEDEAAESVVEGWEFLASRGVLPGYSPLQNVPWSGLGRVQPPSVEYVLRLEVALRKILQAHDLLPNRPGEPAAPRFGRGLGRA